MPSSWPSFHLNFSAYLPTGSADTGFALGLNMGNSPDLVCGGSPGWRPVLLRSSSHSAHGQALRRKGNGYWERCLSFHSISTPVPAVKCTLTDFGSVEGMIISIAEKRSQQRARPKDQTTDDLS